MDSPAENSDDEGVGNDGDEYEEGHEAAVERDHEVQGSQPGGAVHQVAGALPQAAQPAHSQVERFIR